MPGQFNIETVWDFSWDGCVKYSNLIFPFAKLWGLPEIDHEVFFQDHLKLANKFVSTQNSINDYVQFWKEAMKRIDQEIWEYLKHHNWTEVVPTCNWTNPSMKLDNTFREIVEFCALRLQDVARLCLQINNQPVEVLRKANLVKEYEKLLKVWFPEDVSVIKMLDSDWPWITMLKDLRNEWWRHQWWDSHWRELIFHPVKIDFSRWPSTKPKLQIPTFEFNGGGWKIIIHDFKDFFNVLMHNIFELSIDWLALAYSHRSKMPAPIIKSMIQCNRIDNKKDS